jgi:7-cyano-7-deazaguanine reductase
MLHFILMFSDTTTSLDIAISKGILPKFETFDCPYDTKKQATGVIRIVFPEFTCVCPKTGYPDFAAIHLLYLPRNLCLELKSWKLYLNSFRMIGTFHESVTAHIFNEICTVLSPKWALVIGDFLPRGNVDTTIVFETPVERPVGVDLLCNHVAPHCTTLSAKS